MDDLRYPTGRLAVDPAPTAETRRDCIAAIADMPEAVGRALDGLTDEQLATPYRPGGWTVQQLVHHLADSHMNAYIRFKLALTEEAPTIKPYDENAWAQLPDSDATPVSTSLALISALHERWVRLLESMAAEDFARPLVHPERGRMTTDALLQTYAWHSRHHTAHITALRARQGW